MSILSRSGVAPARAGLCLRCGVPFEAQRNSAYRTCADCRVRLYAAVFIRRRATRIGPLRAGHVGWAFQVCADGPVLVDAGAAIRSGLWSAGSVENDAARPLCLPGRTGYWCEMSTDLPTLMRTYRYDEYKLVPVDDAIPEAAQRVQAAIAGQPYALLLLNCVTRTKQVLRAFGAALPSTRRYLIPNDWFDQIAAPAARLL